MEENIQFSVRPYLPENKDAIIRLLNSPSTKPSIWEWQFDHRYFTSKISPIVAFDRWENVIGFNGMMPVKLYIKEQGLKEAAWSCDFFVSREFRGKGVGKEIKVALKKQSDITLALGTSPTAANVLNQSGWHSYNKVYMYTFQGNHFENQKKSEHVQELSSLPESHTIDQLWNTIKNDYTAIIERNHSYLQWRYEKFPIGKYNYLAYFEKGKLFSLCVYRKSDRNLFIVDYIGPKESQNDKTAFINTLLAKDGAIQCTCSCEIWDTLLLLNGFSKSKESANCFIYSTSNELAKIIKHGLFIMSGDCDGDILGASIHNSLIQDSYQTEISTQLISNLEEFNLLEGEWNKLLNKSDNNNLFLSWTWSYNWWLTFSKVHNFELMIITSWFNNQLIGIAPLYKRNYKLFGIPIKQLQLIGCSWSGPNTFRSEYLDFIVDQNFKREATVSLLKQVFNTSDWDEFILGDIREDSITTRLIQEYSAGGKLLTRCVHQDASIQVPLTSDMDEYASKLSSNFRRSVFTKQKHLKDKELVHFTLNKELNAVNENIIDTLDRLHLPRWGKPCFKGKTKEFHEQLIKEYNQTKQLFISSTHYKDKIIALAYSISYNGTLYNIQLGFDEELLKKYSLGLIQLGQSIREGFEDPSVESFDLLAGNGKNSFYKERFGGRRTHIETKQYLRLPFLKLIYRLYDKQKSIMRKLRR